MGGRTALIVVVPAAQAIYDAWRERWDPAPGIPAHVTLLFPFRPAALVDGELLEELRELFAAFEAFEAEYAEVRRFEKVVWLAPEPAARFVSLTKALLGRYPEYPPYGDEEIDEIVPHLSIVNRASPELMDEVASALVHKLPLRESVREATLLEEDEEGAWHPRARFPLRY
ncbi:MAG TPA: 2'-5' RNA ligase family protein [Gaiellaceae bacterium]